MASYEDNTSQGKGWIFDSSSTVHVCSQKELFNNSLVVKKKGIINMVDGLAYEVISTWTVKVTGRDGTVRALEAVWYVPEVRYCWSRYDANCGSNIRSQHSQEY